MLAHLKKLTPFFYLLFFVQRIPIFQLGKVYLFNPSDKNTLILIFF